LNETGTIGARLAHGLQISEVCGQEILDGQSVPVTVLVGSSTVHAKRGLNHKRGSFPAKTLDATGIPATDDFQRQQFRPVYWLSNGENKLDRPLNDGKVYSRPVIVSKF